MSNDFYNYNANILPLGVARSQPIVQQFDAIARAFNKIPNPAGTVRGFSQPVQVGPAEQNNQAATLGQVQQIVDAIMGSNPLSVGNLQPVFRGAYDAGTSYSPLEFVAWNDGLFVNILASQGIAPSNAANWLQVMDPLVTGIAYYELLSGAVSRPLIAFHNGDYWMLTMDLPDVTAAVPGASVAWQRIPEDTTYIAQPTIVDPADGDTEFFGDVTASAYATGERFTGLHTKSVWQASEVSDFATVYAEAELTEGDLTVWTLPLPAPLAEVWIRVRYESAGFSSSWSPITRIVVANYSADPAAFISPTAAQTGWVPGTAFQITAYTPNIIDTHQSTSWQVMNSLGTVIWQSLEDTVNLTTITAPDNIFSPEAVYTVRARHIGTFFGEQEWSAPVTFTTITHPAATLTTPLNAETDVTPELTLEMTVALGGLTHTASQWRVWTETDPVGAPGVFDNLAHDSGETAANLLSYAVPLGVLVISTAYQWEARAKTAEYGLAPYTTRRGFTTQAIFPPTSVVAGTPTLSGNGNGVFADAAYVYAAHVGSPYLTIVNKTGWSAVAGTPILAGVGYGIFADDSYVYAGHVGSPYLTIINKGAWSVVAGTPVLPSSVTCVFADDTYVYAAHGTSAYTVLNKADWSVVAGTPALATNAWGIYADAAYIYVSTTSTPFFNVINKADWSIVAGTPAVAGLGRDIHADATYVYVAHEASPFFTVVNKADWTVVVGTPVLPGKGWGVWADDFYVYVAHEMSPYLTVINKADWSVVADAPIPNGIGYDVFADATYAYVAHANSPRLTILER